MRYLLEDEAKALLAAIGIAIPRSWAADAIPDTVPGPFMVKVLVHEGRRGLRGGVQVAQRGADVAAVGDAIARRWDGVEVNGIYVEEQIVDVVNELYLGIIADRDRAVPLLLVGSGGVEVEQSGVEQIPMDPISPWRPHVERRLIQLLRDHVPGVDPSSIVDVARRIVTLFYEEGAGLVEINPLGVRTDGSVVALDAKVVAAGGSAPTALPGKTLQAVGRRRGISVADGGGDVAVLTSGAGLLMATVDLLGDRSASLGPLVDLGGLVFGTADHVPEVVRAVLDRQPRRILFNYFLQLASCEQLATRIASVVDACGVEVIVRQRGRDADQAQRILQAAGCTVVDDLVQACDLAAATADGQG